MVGRFDECETHIILSPFFIHILDFNIQFNEKLWNLHRINVLQGFRAKEAKTSRKTTDLAKAKSAECHDNQKFVTTKLKENRRRSVATKVEKNS